jgi:hypothetical protein
MSTRHVLAANLDRLMDAAPGLSTLAQITAAGGGSNGTLDRIRRATTGTSVDNLEALAKVFGVEPWHLLMPTLQARRSGHTQPHVSGVPVWPFSSELLAAVQQLSPEETMRLENVARAYLGLASLYFSNDTVTNGLRKSAVEQKSVSVVPTPALDRENARHKEDGTQDGDVAEDRRRRGRPRGT